MLALELAAYVTSLSRSAESLDSVPRPSFVCVWFELDLWPPMDVGKAILRVEVSVGSWVAVAAPAPSGEEVPLAPSVGEAGENAGSY